MEKLKEKLKEMYENLMDRDNEILVLADEQDDPELLEFITTHLVQAAQGFKYALQACEHHEKTGGTLGKQADLSLSSLEELVEFANVLDSSGNPELQKKASVIDQLLLNFGKAKLADEVFKEAQEAELNKLRSEQREKGRERSYDFPGENQAKEIKAEEAKKKIEESIKTYRPLETNLSTRYCPDHPGTGAIRVGDNVYQCPLDKKIYNYTEGFTTMKGNKVPGTDVQNQTRDLGDRNLEQMHFSTRESRLTE